MRRSTLHRLLVTPKKTLDDFTTKEIVTYLRVKHPGATLPGDEPNVTMLAFARAVRDLVQRLREIEREHPTLPRFDESTLPKRAKDENEFAWRERQLDFLQAYIRDLVARLDR